MTVLTGENNSLYSSYPLPHCITSFTDTINLRIMAEQSDVGVSAMERPTILLRLCLLIFAYCVSIARGLADPGAEAIIVGEATVTEGDSIMLSCAVYNVSGEDAKSFRMEWRRDGVVLSRGQRVLSPDPRYRVTMMDGVSDRRDFVLHIDQVNRSDAGRYLCWVIVRPWYQVLSSKKATSAVALTVNYFPRHPRCRHEGRSNVFLPGSLVRIICSVQEGEPTVRTRWKGQNDVVLIAQESHQGGYVNNVLTFEATSTHDGMEFICKVTSEAFPHLSSNCRVGPIVVTDVIQDEELSMASYSESSVEAPNFVSSELAPAPIARTTMLSESVVTGTVTPNLDMSENLVRVVDSTTQKKLSLCLTIFVLLFVISLLLNAFLYRRLKTSRRTKSSKAEENDNNIAPSDTSGVSNEEYMDMQSQRQTLREGQFYSSIAGDTMRAILVQSDSPRSSIAGPSAASPQSSVVGPPATSVAVTPRSSIADLTTGTPRSSVVEPVAIPPIILRKHNSIYENLGGRPITPPRSKRRSRQLSEEHNV